LLFARLVNRFIPANALHLSTVIILEYLPHDKDLLHSLAASNNQPLFVENWHLFNTILPPYGTEFTAALT
jgi:hypothetical protein